MFKINNFSFAHAGSEYLLNGLYLNLEAGEKVVLLGSNGVGKTSILQALWEASFEKTNQVQFSLSKAYFTQDIPESLNLQPQKPNTSVYEILYEIWNDKLPAGLDVLNWLAESVNTLPKDFNERLNLNLFDMKLAPGFLAPEFSQLSPGTKKKLLLAILFASDPEVILADELTNHLDKEAIDVLILWLQKARGRLLLVDHNQEFLEAVARHFLFLPNNRERKVLNFPNLSFSETMAELDVLESRQKEDAIHLERRQKFFEKAIETAQWKATTFDSTTAGARVGQMQKRLEREVTNNSLQDEFDAQKRVDFVAKVDSKVKIKADCLVSIQDLAYKIGTKREQLITEFKLYHGQRVRLTGPNGSGKSTLLKLITSAIYKHDLHQEDQYVSGVIEILNLTSKQLFVLEQVTNYPHSYKLQEYILRHTDFQTYGIMPFLRQLELDKFKLDSPINHLSMGEFIRLQLGLCARILGNLKLLVLDEPGNFLDVFTQKALVNLLQKYRGSLLLVSHDEALVKKVQVEEEFGL